MTLRIVAGFLAAGGILWGTFVFLLLLAFQFPPLAVIVFVPGYLVTAGYVIRALSKPPLDVCFLIWLASILVQGAWLGWFIGQGGLSQLRAPIDGLMAGWWMAACTLSAWAFWYEFRCAAGEDDLPC